MVNISEATRTPLPGRKPPQMNMQLFSLLVAFLILANGVVFFLTPLRNAIIGLPKAAMIEDFMRQKKSLLDLLREVCSSDAFDRFRRGDFGLIPDFTPKPVVLPPAAPMRDGNALPSPGASIASGQDPASADFRARLARQTVRVISEQTRSGGASSGSGFFISKDLVITNQHVVEGSASGEAFVTSQSLGSQPLRAKVIAATQESTIAQPDFALLRIERPPSDVQIVELADNPVPLDDVIAAGFPGRTIASDENSVSPATVFSRGVVSVVQPRRDGASLIIHTADIAPGSSGGPLVNRCGQVVGVNTFINAGETPSIEGRSLVALSSESLKSFLKSINQPFVASTGLCPPVVAK